MLIRRLSFMIVIVAVLSLSVQGSASGVSRSGSSAILEGTFTVLWGDGDLGSSGSQTRYFLTITQHDIVELNISPKMLAGSGGVNALNQKQVVVQGPWLDSNSLIQVQSLAVIQRADSTIQGVSGPQPWVSILCKFADYADEPRNYGYFTGMYSNNYPGLDNFWRQNSYGLANLEGSGVYGWYQLPHNRDYYLPGGNLDWWTAAQDCTAAADPTVNFSSFVGINLMFNAVLDCCAWGGTWYACLDGLCKIWRTTWEPPWGYENIGVIAHETGHGFGLPHSLGNCQAGYDNRWDVMSDVWSNGADPIFGTTSQQTISYHKQLLGWLPAGRVFNAPVGTLSTISLEKLALPQTENYLEAVIPIDGQQGHFYTLEVRQPSSNPEDYDKWLPGFAVIIHEVNEGNPEPAVLIDQDGNCDTGDAGAMYMAGEVFSDSTHGISVSIISAATSGFHVTINNRFNSMHAVELAGSSSGNLGESIPFTATVSPSDATTPITYTWQASGLLPEVHKSGTQDTINLTWDEMGTKTITVRASNAGGFVVETHLIDIKSRVAPASVAVIGPENGFVGNSYNFTAEILPITTTLPVRYVWSIEAGNLITDVGGISDTITVEWEFPGVHQIRVTASNLAGNSSDSWITLIYSRAFIPLILNK